MKKVKISIIIFSVLFLLTTNTYALGDTFSTAENFMQTGRDYSVYAMNTSTLNDASSNIYNMLLAVATGVALIVGAILGIRFMTAGVDRKVEVKEALFPYIVSCIVVFGSMGIWKLTVKLLASVEKPPSASTTNPQLDTGTGSTTHESSSGATHGGGGTRY